MIFLFKRLFSIFTSLFFISLGSFILFRLLPGSPFSEDALLAPLMQERLNQLYGFDKNIILQFISFLQALVAEGGGLSLFYNVSAWSLFLQKMGLTFFLAMASLGLATSLCYVIYRVLPLPRFEVISRHVSAFTVSLPLLFFAPILIFVVARIFPNLPVLYNPSDLISLCLPILLLSVRPFGILLRLLSTEADVWSRSLTAQNFRGLGFSEDELRKKWILKLSLIPVTTAFVGLFSSLLVGSLLTETFFSIPGLGSTYIQALLTRDYPVFTSWTIYFAFLFLVLQAIFDLIHMKLDPRVEIRS